MRRITARGPDGNVFREAPDVVIIDRRKQAYQRDVSSIGGFIQSLDRPGPNNDEKARRPSVAAAPGIFPSRQV